MRSSSMLISSGVSLSESESDLELFIITEPIVIEVSVIVVATSELIWIVNFALSF